MQLSARTNDDKPKCSRQFNNAMPLYSRLNQKHCSDFRENITQW